MIGLSVSNELKRLCKEVIKAFAWGDVRYPPKNLNVVCVFQMRVVRSEPRHKSQPL